MQSRKFTAWKKNRNFGDIKGGRTALKCKNGIFNRLHNLSKPSAFEETPIYITENPSRNYYFPVSVDEIRNTLHKLPPESTEHITHIWLKKRDNQKFKNPRNHHGKFIVGSGVYLIILHPFPCDMRMFLGRQKPSPKLIRYFQKYGTVLKRNREGIWYLLWCEDEVKKYYMENLLLSLVGYSIDSFYNRFWSPAAVKESEDFAEGYASYWGKRL